MMNYFKRATLSLRKHPFKTGVLFCVILLLTGLMAFAIVIRQAIINTDLALRAQLPPVVTLRIDEEKLLYYSEHGLVIGDSGRITVEMIQEIGGLPYVHAFNFTQSVRLFSDELTRVQVDGDDVIDFSSLTSLDIYHLEAFFLEGVYYHENLNIQSGFLELVAGRTFLPEEIQEGSHVMVVSQAFMEANNVSLGETISLDFMVWGTEDTDFTDDDLLLKEHFEFEIIGVFHRDLPDESEIIDIQQHLHVMNEMYVPVTAVIPILEAWAQILPETDFSETEIEELSLELTSVYDPIVFLLNDPTLIPDFRAVSDEMIPYFWTFSDLSNAYGDMSNAMLTMLDISDGLFMGAIFSTIASLGLLMLMLLNERQHEIGVYLALGERKKRIIAQFVLEVSVISIIAVTSALFVGNVVASRMTENMIRTELSNQVFDESSRAPVWAGSPESIGFTHYMTHDDMLELYDATMSMESILFFYGVTLTTVLVSALVPICVMVSRTPKDLLTLKDV